MTSAVPVPQADETRLRAALQTIGRAVEHGVVAGWTPAPRRHRLPTAALGLAIATAVVGGLLVWKTGRSPVAVHTTSQPSATEASETSPSLKAAAAELRTLLPRIAGATGASFPEGAVDTAVKSIRERDAAQEPALRAYLQGLDPRAAAQEINFNDVLAVGGVTVAGYPILVQVYLPVAADKALIPDRPAFWQASVSRTGLGDGMNEWVTTVGGPGGTTVTRVEVHRSNLVVGFAVEAQAELTPTAVASLTAAVTG